jgi:hypothetical protein
MDVKGNKVKKVLFHDFNSQAGIVRSLKKENGKSITMNRNLLK